MTAQGTFVCRQPRSTKEIMAESGLRHWKTSQSNYLLPLIETGILERTILNKRRSRMQQSRTAADRQSLLTHDRQMIQTGMQVFQSCNL